MNRDQAIQMRKKVYDSLKQFGKNPKNGFNIGNVEGHVNFMTHNDICWKNFSDNKFVGLDFRLSDGSDKQLFDQSFEQTSEECVKIVNLIKEKLKLNNDFVVKRTRDDKEEYNLIEENGIYLRFHLKNDANGWGRSNIILMFFWS